MPGRRSTWTFAGIASCLVLVAQAYALPLVSRDALSNPDISSGTVRLPDGTQIDFYRQGGLLPNGTDYHWWYGCSPTSAGMMMGHYNRNGYDDRIYRNLATAAEHSTHYWKWYWFPFIGEWLADGDTNACDAIASPEHINDFYRSGYDGSGDDQPTQGRQPNCLADFMGTSQDACGNKNGATTFFNDTYGRRANWTDIAAADQKYSGMYGMYEYVDSRGYDVATLYNQYTDNHRSQNHTSGGFTLDQYKTEIDAGRGVLVHVAGHTMYGCGYKSGTDTIYVQDTWKPGPHEMTCGGSYSGMALQSVTVMEVTGGQGPVFDIYPADGGTLGFGYVLVGESKTGSVGIANPGIITLEGQFPALSGDFSPHTATDFLLEPNWWMYVSPAPRYTPSSRGSDTVEITVTSNVGDSTMILSGIGVAPVAHLDTTAADAGLARIGGSGTCSLTVVNAGDGNLSGEGDVSNLRGTMSSPVTGNFTGPGGSFSLADLDSQTFTFTYSPTGRGGDLGLVLCHFANGSFNKNQSQTLEVALEGTGVGPIYESSPPPGSTFDFGQVCVGSPVSVSFDILNVTTDDDGGDSTLTDLTLVDFLFDGPDAEWFFVSAGLAGTVVPKGGLAQLAVSFAPLSAKGFSEATLTIVTDQGAPLGEPGDTFTYRLVGVAVPEPSTMAILGVGLLGAVRRRRRKRGRREPIRGFRRREGEAPPEPLRLRLEH